jgi:hypothetical protein
MGLRRSQRAEVLELVRSELHVELARAVAQSADRVRVDLAREADVAGALDRLAEVCERLVERIDADRAERRTLADAIAGLAPPRPRGSAVIGGSVDPGVDPALDPVERTPDAIVLGAPVGGDGFLDVVETEPRTTDEIVLDDAEAEVGLGGRRPFDWGG